MNKHKPGNPPDITSTRSPLLYQGWIHCLSKMISVLIASETSLDYFSSRRFFGHLEILLLDEVIGHIN